MKINNIFFLNNIFFYLKYCVLFFLVKLFKNNYSLKRKELFNFLLKFNRKNQLDNLIVYSDPAQAVKSFLRVKKKIINYSQNYSFAKNFIFKNSKKKKVRTFLLGENKKIHFPTNLNFFRSKSFIGEYQNIKINNWHGFPIIIHNNKIIEKISSKYAPLSIEKKILIKKKINFIEAFLLFSDLDIENYCHFILDIFSKTYFLKNINNKKIVILLPKFNLSEYHNFFFQILIDKGYQLYFMDINESISVKKLFVIEDFDHPAGLVNNNIINYLRSLVKPKLTVKKKVLWITRRNRRVINEDQIIRKLKKNYDLNTVDLERISVVQQINLFNEHEVYIGPHGAGFTNIIFVNPIFKRKLIEIFPEGLGTPTYCMISSSQNIKHYSYVGKNISTFQSNYSNIFINEKEFLDLVKKII